MHLPFPPNPLPLHPHQCLCTSVPRKSLTGTSFSRLIALKNDTFQVSLRSFSLGSDCYLRHTGPCGLSTALLLKCKYCFLAIIQTGQSGTQPVLSSKAKESSTLFCGRAMQIKRLKCKRHSSFLSHWACQTSLCPCPIPSI